MHLPCRHRTSRKQQDAACESTTNDRGGARTWRQAAASQGSGSAARGSVRSMRSRSAFSFASFGASGQASASAAASAAASEAAAAASVARMCACRGAANSHARASCSRDASSSSEGSGSLQNQGIWHVGSHREQSGTQTTNQCSFACYNLFSHPMNQVQVLDQAINKSLLFCTSQPTDQLQTVLCGGAPLQRCVPQ